MKTTPNPRHPLSRIATAAALGLAPLVVAAIPAHAGGAASVLRSGDDDDRVITTGSCSAGARWKLKVKTDDGRLEVEGEVDTNRAGQAWAWTLRHNGSVSARGTSTTTARSGSFEVERTIVDLAGTDRVVFRATYAGQTCGGVVNF